MAARSACLASLEGSNAVFAARYALSRAALASVDAARRSATSLFRAFFMDILIMSGREIIAFWRVL
jgi:hypothetical protein